jgi:hypothetical protein
MPSWPDAPSAWQPGGSQHYDSGMLPARLLPSARRAGIAVCTNPRHARDLTPNGTRADAAPGTTAAPAGDVRGTACPLLPGARALPRRCREEQPQYQENDVIDVRLHAADAIVFLDFSPFRCACRAIRRSPERADFWKWLLCIAAAAVRYSGRRSPNTPAMPSSTSCRPRERSGDSSRR